MCTVTSQGRETQRILFSNASLPVPNSYNHHYFHLVWFPCFSSDVQKEHMFPTNFSSSFDERYIFMSPFPSWFSHYNFPKQWLIMKYFTVNQNLNVLCSLDTIEISIYKISAETFQTLFWCQVARFLWNSSRGQGGNGNSIDRGKIWGGANQVEDFVRQQSLLSQDCVQER